MTSRLVLGSGSLAQALVTALSDRQGDLLVLAADENAVETLREEGVAAETGDVTDAAVLDGLDRRPDTVAVATADPATNVAAARAARRTFPHAFLLAYAGRDTPEDDPADPVASLGDVADQVVHPGTATTNHLMSRIGDGGVRTRKLMAVLRDVDEPLAIVTHDNPDPDAIASAIALQRIAAAAGCAADVCYYGDITHQENRAFVNLLEYDLRNLEPDSDLSEYGGFALVDHSRPGVNDGLPEDTTVDVVVDHHPPRLPVEARFVDLRSEVGATSTLLVGYLSQLGITPDEDVATGLLFGIRVDTDGFSREVSPDDFEAAGYLQPYADLGTLERIESPSMSPETLDTIARAIRNRERHGPILCSGVGRLTDRDALAQAADRLLTLDGVTTTLVYGVMDGTIYVSARARGTDIDLGETLRDSFGRIGSAGGHADMAGAQISLGLLEAIDEGDESLSEVVEAMVTDRFLEAVDSRTNRVLADVYTDDFHGFDHLETADGPLDDLPESIPAEDGGPTASGRAEADDEADGE